MPAVQGSLQHYASIDSSVQPSDHGCYNSSAYDQGWRGTPAGSWALHRSQKENSVPAGSHGVARQQQLQREGEVPAGDPCAAGGLSASVLGDATNASLAGHYTLGRFLPGRGLHHQAGALRASVGSGQAHQQQQAVALQHPLQHSSKKRPLPMRGVHPAEINKRITSEWAGGLFVGVGATLLSARCCAAGRWLACGLLSFT